MHPVSQHMELSDPQSSGLWHLEGMCKPKKSYKYLWFKTNTKKKNNQKNCFMKWLHEKARQYLIIGQDASLPSEITSCSRTTDWCSQFVRLSR